MRHPDRQRSSLSSRGSHPHRYAVRLDDSDAEPAPAGWTVLNYKQDPATNPYFYGDIDYQALRNHYSYAPAVQAGVHNWSITDHLIPKYGNPANWTGGWVPSCANQTILTYGSDGLKCYQNAQAQDTTITVNFYKLDTAQTGKNYAGLQINETELQKWKNAHPGVDSINGSARGIRSLTVQAQCWQGNLSERPSPGTGKLKNITARYDSAAASDNKLVAAATIPENTATDHPTRYSCIYGLHQQVYTQDTVCTSSGPICNTIYNQAEETKLYYGGSQGTKTRPLGNNAGSGTITTGFITEGVPSSLAGNLNTTVKVIPVPGSNGQHWLKHNNDAKTGGPLWTHFFKGSPLSPADRPRHPGKRYCDKHGSAPGCPGS